MAHCGQKGPEQEELSACQEANPFAPTFQVFVCPQRKATFPPNFNFVQIREIGGILRSLIERFFLLIILHALFLLVRST